MSKYNSDVKVSEIEKNIPVERYKKLKYPFTEMDINDSFLVDIGSMKFAYIRTSIRGCFQNLCKRDEYKGWKILIRKIDNTHIRCWRIK